MKRKILLILCFGFVTASLTSCSTIEKVLMGISKISQEEIYTEYENNNSIKGFNDSLDLYKQNGEIGGDYYNSISGEHLSNGSVHVSFSLNNNLIVEYYLDKDLKIPIEGLSCDLNPGDCVYAIVKNNDETVSESSYAFSGFNMYEIKRDDNSRNMMTDLLQDYTNQNLAFEIPKDFKGDNISVVPVGTYKSRNISLDDYCVDQHNNKVEISGIWRVNDKEYSNSQVEFSPIEPYIVSYSYDTDKYFFLGSEPECFYRNELDGSVVFKECQPEDEIKNFKIELSEYFTKTIDADTERKVSINNEKEQLYKEGEEVTLRNLKYGDVVTIQTNKKWDELENCKEFVLIGSKTVAASSPSSGVYSYVYTLLVPEKEGSFTFNPSDYSYPHGKISFKCMGKTIYGPQVIAKERKIYYEAISCDDGYYLPGNDNYITVSDEESTKKQLESIKFLKTRKVYVSLPQPEYGGSVSYYIDGKEIHSDSVNIDVKKEIVINFEPDPGWKCNYKDGYTYEVQDLDSQNIDIINDCFQEYDGHKPELKVILEQSLGKDMSFNFSASGLTDKDYQYEDGWFRKEYTVIKDKKIGTEIPLKISAYDKALEANKAVRVEIERIDSRKSKYTEVFCYDDLTEDIPDINIYSSEYLNRTKYWCKNVNITIGITETQRFEFPEKQEGLIVEVYDVNTGKMIQVNDLIDLNRQVRVELSTENGYVFGKSSTAKYTEKMKYSDYLKKIESMMNSHSAKKICSINLDNTEPISYAYYTLDGKEVYNNINAFEGQELKITYKLLDKDYKIKKTAGTMSINNLNDKEITKTIKISKDMDGKVITREIFNIEVEKR